MPVVVTPVHGLLGVVRVGTDARDGLAALPAFLEKDDAWHHVATVVVVEPLEEQLGVAHA